MRKKIVAGNWKMNKTAAEAKSLMLELLNYKKNNVTHCEVYIAPPSLYLIEAENVFSNKEIGVYAQDLSMHKNGAYTGELSVEMFVSIGIDGSLVSHSERRAYFGETDAHANQKIKALLAAGLTPIYCNGEQLDQRKANQHLEVVKNQTTVALAGLTPEEVQKVVIAYEPVWAIGTGETATPEQAQEMHAYIRNTIADLFGKETAEQVSILYGGSVKPDNAKEIFSQPDVDGGLIGGASLKLEDFTKIIEAFNP